MIVLTFNVYSTTVKYSKSFTISDHDKYKVVKIYNVDGSELYQSFVLANNIGSIPSQYSELPFIQTPLKRYASLSTTHLFQLKQLDETQGLTGIGFFRYISDPLLVNKLKAKKTIELGMPGQMNLESTIASKSQVIFSYYVSSDETVVSQAQRLGTHTVFIQEYLESHPLAYAEWIKLFACFFDKEREGNEIFKEIESRYLDLKGQVAKTKQRPKVIVNENYGGTWYVPNKDSFMAKLIEDAGGNYVFKDLPGRGSSKLSFETIISKSLDAKYWLNPGQAKTLAALKSNDSRYELFTAFKQKMVYNNNKRSLLGLPNNYFDEALVQPHLLLADLVSIFHPSLLKSKTIWYHRLK